MRVRLRYIMVFLCLFGISCGVSSLSHSQEPSPPYKAKTVDECVQEKECVWYAFEGLVFSNEKYISKREEDVAIRVIGKIRTIGIEVEDFSHILKGVTTEIGENIPFSVDVKDPWNVLVVFSDHFEEDIVRNYAKIFLKITGGSSFIDRFKGVLTENPVGINCYGNSYSGEDLAMNTSIVVSFVNEQHVPRCLYKTLLSDLGFRGRLNKFRFSILNTSAINANKLFGYPDEATDLDYFLLRILYDQNFKSGMNVEKAKLVFDRIYDTELKKWKINRMESNK